MRRREERRIRRRRVARWTTPCARGGGSCPRYDANVDEYDDGVCIDVDDDGPIQTRPRRRNRDGDVDDDDDDDDENDGGDEGGVADDDDDNDDDDDPTTATTDAATMTTNKIAAANATRISADGAWAHRCSRLRRCPRSRQRRGNGAARAATTTTANATATAVIVAIVIIVIIVFIVFIVIIIIAIGIVDVRDDDGVVIVLRCIHRRPRRGDDGRRLLPHDRRRGRRSRSRHTRHLSPHPPYLYKQYIPSSPSFVFVP
jgi:hypothetical protein